MERMFDTALIIISLSVTVIWFSVVLLLVMGATLLAGFGLYFLLMNFETILSHLLP
jgi:hypothetical protein